MAQSSHFAEALRALRLEKGLSQAALAGQAGLSVSAVQSYEQGRRLPDVGQVERFRVALALDDQAYDHLRCSAGLPPLPPAFVSTLKKARGPVETIWDEVQDFPWVCLIMNERREIVAWNRLANRTAELDFATTSPLQRNLLRMAATEHYERHLTNWEELIGRLISFFKVEGSDLADGTAAQYLQTVFQSIIADEPPRFPQRILSLFASVAPWREEDRNVHPIRWRLDDGTELAFNGAFCDFDVYDGTWAFDWHAADGRTAEWVRAQADTDAALVEPEVLPFSAVLAEERRLAKLSRKKLGDLAGVSAASIEAYESETRRPSRAAILALCRALTIDGYSTNRFFREAGFEEEPSDLARWLAGDEPVAVFRGRRELMGVGTRTIYGACNGLTWPSAVLDASCHVVHANPLAGQLFGLDRWKALPGRPGPHLLQLMVSNEFLAQVRNWEEVAGVILPGRLEPLVMGADRESSSRGLREVATQLRRDSAAGIERLADVWRTSPGFNSLRRPGVRFDWTAGDGAELAFNCVISGWNSADPYKALDLFPADAATFAWLGLE